MHLGTLEKPPLNLENKDMLNYTVVSVSFPKYTPMGTGERRRTFDQEYWEGLEIGLDK